MSATRGVAEVELIEWLAVAEEASRRAGAYLEAARTATATVLAEPGRDVKLTVDHEAEALILAVLGKRSDIPILSEERGWVGGEPDPGDVRWLVDPLDGSMNYLKGIPMCCVSIALWAGDVPLLGAVYDFNHHEMFSGVAGKGAWLNGDAIHPSAVATVDRAVLSTGFPVGMDLWAGDLGAFIEQVRAYKKIRLLGSAALSLAYVAAGRVDAYFERNIKLWDVAGGLAVLHAAGGRIVSRPGGDGVMMTVYAGNRALLPLALE